MSGNDVTFSRGETAEIMTGKTYGNGSREIRRGGGVWFNMADSLSNKGDRVNGWWSWYEI